MIEIFSAGTTGASGVQISVFDSVEVVAGLETSIVSEPVFFSSFPNFFHPSHPSRPAPISPKPVNHELKALDFCAISSGFSPIDGAGRVFEPVTSVTQESRIALSVMNCVP